MISEVSLIAINSGHEPHAIRTICETFGIVVHTHWIGSPTQLANLMSAGRLSKTVILSAHGTETGLWFGEFGSEVDTSLLVDGSMPTKRFSEFDLVNSREFIITACQPNNSSFGKELLKAGAELALFPTGYVDAARALLFVHLLLFKIMEGRRDVASAFGELVRTNDDVEYSVVSQFELLTRS